MERRSIGTELHVLLSPAFERRGFMAAFTERTGGVSGDLYSSLNLGLETGDDPALVARNRERLRAKLEIPAPVTARQVHGSDVLGVDGKTGHVGDGDALTTSTSGVAMAVMVADCVPLALASEAQGALAVVHLGWRGVAAGLVQKALSTFSEPAVVVAAIGPAIGPCHYEVGEDVAEAVNSGVDGLAVADRSGPLPRLDLGATIEALLRNLGIVEIDRAEECTACEPERFFSHRRDGLTGRQALVAMRL
ncbi:MAG: peptidoglycan editing factor PgeF [Actinomycetota bacterium]